MPPDSHGTETHDETTNERLFFFDKPKNVRLVMRLFFAACGLVFALDLVNLILKWTGGHEIRHAERSWEGFPGFYAAYGFVGCVFLVLVAKQMRRVLMRDEDYYDR